MYIHRNNWKVIGQSLRGKKKSKLGGLPQSRTNFRHFYPWTIDPLQKPARYHIDYANVYAVVCHFSTGGDLIIDLP